MKCLAGIAFKPDPPTSSPPQPPKNKLHNGLNFSLATLTRYKQYINDV